MSMTFATGFLCGSIYASVYLGIAWHRDKRKHHR